MEYAVSRRKGKKEDGRQNVYQSGPTELNFLLCFCRNLSRWNFAELAVGRGEVSRTIFRPD